MPNTTDAPMSRAARIAWLQIAAAHMADRMVGTGVRQGIHCASERAWHKEERTRQRQRRALRRILAALAYEVTR